MQCFAVDCPNHGLADYRWSRRFGFEGTDLLRSKARPMTEPAPNQGERTMSEDTEVKVDDKLISDIEFEVGMGTGAWDQVDPEELIAAVLKCCSVVPKSALDAATAAREQAEAACGELRQEALRVIGLFEDVGNKTEWSDGDETDRVYTWYELEPLAKLAENSQLGKSTADELRRLRDGNNNEGRGANE